MEITGKRYEDLLATWGRWSSHNVWTAVLRSYEATGNKDNARVARDVLSTHDTPSPLEALAATAELIQRLEGTRWQAIQAAREAGASWAEIGEAIGTTGQRAGQIYRAAIEAQEEHSVQPHEPYLDAARAVLGDE